MSDEEIERMNKMMSNNLKAARIRSGFTQGEVAKCLKIDRKTYNRWENKPLFVRPSELLPALALYGISPKMLHD